MHEMTHCTDMAFTRFLSGGFTIANVINPDGKLGNPIAMHWGKNPSLRSHLNVIILCSGYKNLLYKFKITDSRLIL